MSRILNHPIFGKINDRKQVSFQFDGKTYEAYENETIAAALLANDVRKLRVHEDSGTPRGFYCNIGHCMECRVTVNGQSNTRACLTVVQQDMVVESGKLLPNIIRRMVEEQ
ncbi:(2Fe-2S)-binding protein [Neobacillus mesonae]|uniref:(2Fe-2S)-binding protein n=1 Tax=Neobacillus mesonae TaxID=1193713 RepID=UPI00203AEEB3|nr:(2Fe-2S)-binding protein [Neobacillus mesonae]MCM3569954.1 (2Fe-2S)-binding protein [Neobacillus mesonae]